ncbi:CBS domain-containing protein [Streptomyces griseoflavus]|uniref:CBS domain-containing protein n=1 Tax=Streptomyces griseoflavus TaxID=35619 RepID=UPI0033AB3D95
MSLVQTHSRPADAPALRTTATGAAGTAAWPRVWDGMTVEVALSVMAAAGTGHLVVCDEDDLCTDVVTRARLTAVRDGSAYTDRVRLRDVAGDGSAAGRSVGRQWSE